MKRGYKNNIENLTVENEHFRKVLYTSQYCQLVLMSLKPGEDIGKEVHEENDQFFRFEQGEGRVVIDQTAYVVNDGDAVIVPVGAEHNVVNASTTDELKFYTIYAPPHHKDGIERATKEEAESDAPEFDGGTTES